jgi:peptide deformylase
MRILTVPEDTAVLRTKSQPVKEIGTELVKFLRDLGKTLKHQKDPAGVGLSAIQVGRPIRAFAMYLPEQRTKDEGRRTKEKPVLKFYVNPEIISHPKEMTLGEDLVDQNDSSDLQSSALGLRPFLEGCLSIPDIYGPVLRWPWIKAAAAVFSENDLLDTSLYRRSNLQLVDVSLNGLAGRVFQHELDHLNGILFTDHVLKQGNQLYRDFGDGPEQINL